MPVSFSKWRFAGVLLASGIALLSLCPSAEALPALQVLRPGWRSDFLDLIVDPDIAFVLLLVGIYGLIVEIGHPGVYLPGVAGAISLVLALIAMSALPVHYGALCLLLLGIALMIGETFTPGIGALGIGGLAAFVAGAAFLFDAGSATTAISIPLIAGSAIICAGLTFFTIGAAVEARRRPLAAGPESMIGENARVVEWRNGAGTVLLRGERWSARGGAALNADELVRVTSREGLTLIVERE